MVAEHSCSCTPAAIDPTAIDTAAWQKLIEKVAEDMKAGKIKPGQLSTDIVRETFNEIKAGAAKGYGADFVKFGKDAGRDRSVLKMQKNIFKFSGAKTYAQLEELNSKLVKDGKTVSFDEFKAEALKINEKYNLNYLQSEFQTARQAGHHARNWEKYEADIRLFPNLKYRTAGDKRVRDSHQKLEGKVAPVNSDFWDKYYPPNGWRCRCYVVQSAERVSEELPENVDEVKPQFRMNVGKEKRVFNESGSGEHPYFALVAQNSEAAAEVERQMVKTFRDQVRVWSKENMAGKKKIKHESLDNKKVKISNSDVKSITGKPHRNQTERDELLYNISENFEGSDFLFSAPENKGRPQFVRWYYYKDRNGIFYYNVVEMADGTLRLHAITDKVTKP